MEKGWIVLLGYAFGCIQTAYLLGRFVKKTDIRTHGTNNAGASNATMTFGWKMGVTVALVDMLKAVVAILLIGLVFDLSQTDLQWKYLAGAGVILGHDFPFFMGFKGGKGTASLVGVMAMIDWKMAVIGMVTIILITVLTDYIVWGTFAMLAVFLGFTVYLTMDAGSIAIALALSLLSLWLHRKNVGKIMRGEERGLRSVIYRKN